MAGAICKACSCSVFYEAENRPAFSATVCMTSHTRGGVMRINARLDEQSEQDLQLIKQATGETVSQIIKTLLAERAERLRKKTSRGPS